MSADDKAAAAWGDYIDQQQEEKIEELERELNAANAEVERLTAKIAQLYEGAEEQRQRIKRLEEAGNDMVTEEDVFIRLKIWMKAKEDKP